MESVNIEPGDALKMMLAALVVQSDNNKLVIKQDSVMSLVDEEKSLVVLVDERTSDIIVTLMEAES